MLIASRASFAGLALLVGASIVGLSACSSDEGGSNHPNDGAEGGADSSSGGRDAGSAGSAGRPNASGEGSGAASGRGNAGGGRAGNAGASGGGRAGSVGNGASAGRSGGSAGGDGGSAGQNGNAGSGGGPASPCGAIPTFEDGKSPSREIHVAETGNDSTGDGSSAAPFASLERAVEEAEPGSAVRIHAGTYTGGAYIADLAGSESRPIWIGGAPGEASPVIEGGGTAVHFVRARWLVVHDLEIREQTDNGINADDGDDRADEQASHGLIFRNLSIHDVGSGGNQDCLKLSGINDYLVLDSSFARCGGGDSGSAIDHVGCHDGLIARNEFSDLTGGNAVQCKGGSRNIEVRWNRIRNGGQRAVNLGGSTGFEFFRPPLSTTDENAEAWDIRVIANVIESGIAALGFVGCVDCLAANNTIVDPDKWVLRILQETTSSGATAFLPAQNGRFMNNLIYFTRAAVSTTINVGANTSPESFVFANNLWYAHDAPNRSTPTDFPSAERDGVYGQDPEFSGASREYTIGAGSPAAGAGETLPEITGDITGACFEDPPSIGAFEVR